ncbi:PREDICTED: IgG receptor FcRn large subunit p51 [Colobus angolensis palliatus]|uniref:IgG receptor FcRn large subunit p51 n=1 Tax=Colobus angolensis palliatus TaxID=336983 RepID=A0A2K5I9V4_COLAP|nr:PREDICTED: IgG receptor FcRn large subunit p51 [Colobus angolensis palliatus]
MTLSWSPLSGLYQGLSPALVQGLGDRAVGRGAAAVAALSGTPPPRGRVPALYPAVSLSAESHLSLLYHLTAVSSPAPGTPAFWVSGWLGPQQYLSYNSLRGQAEPCGAWVWENQVSWYWEKETTDLRIKEKLFLEAFKALGGKGPYTLQGLLGCELSPDNTSVPTAKFALNGEEFMNFDLKQGTWGGDWPEALAISQRWQQQDKAANKELTFLLFSCPHRLQEHLERGRGNLEWKEPPSMRLKARPGNPGFSVLTCSAFSFYPPELQLRFLRNGLAAGTGQGDFGPNSDGSFHASSSLTVKSGDEHHYCCIVQHAGLAQPLRVELETPAKSSVLVVGIVIGLLLLTAAAVGGALLWRRMRSGLPAPWISFRGDDTGSLLPTPGEAQDADSKDINVIPATA